MPNSLPTPNKRPINIRRQSIYLLPNLFTLAALFAGFYAIVQSMNKKTLCPPPWPSLWRWCSMAWMAAWRA